MHLRPLLITRIANVVGPLLIAALGVGLALEQHAYYALLLTVLGLWLAARGHRIGVVADERALRVVGLLWSRTIDLGQIGRITLLPAVRWKSVGGRERWSPIYAFADPGRVLRSVEKHNVACRRRLEEWVCDHRAG